RQAIADLEACIAHRDELPVHLDRGLRASLALAYETAGDHEKAAELRKTAGLAESDAYTPRLLGNASIDAPNGFRFSEKRFVNDADDVYVAEGYDFANLAFIVTKDFVVAIDAGTHESTAKEAVAELRKVTAAPIKYVILTHAHWDH